jgi:hypothetical protein
MKRLAIPLLALMLPAGLAAQDTPAFKDNSAVISCYLEQSEWKDGKPQPPPNEEAMLYAIQFEQNQRFSPATAREHDPNGLLAGARMTNMQLTDTPQGKAIIFHGPLADGTRVVLSMLRGKEDERGYLASLGRRTSEGVSQSLDGAPFYTGRCKLWRVESGANLLWEGFLKSEPTLKLGQK